MRIYDINKGCWTNIALGIIGIPVSYIYDSILIGILSGLNLGYFLAYVVYKLSIKKIKQDSSRGLNDK